MTDRGREKRGKREEHGAYGVYGEREEFGTSGSGPGQSDGVPGPRGGLSGPTDVPDDLTEAEAALSRLLKGAVQDVAPNPGSLDHLRRAVPARRARKRQALVGAAAAAVLVGAAVPALLHMAQVGGGGDHTSVAGHGTSASGGAGSGKDADGGRQGPGQPSRGTGGGGHGQEGSGDGQKGDGASADPDPDRTLTSAAPDCAAAALGAAQGSIRPADDTGRVYGSFRVTNVSDSECTVDGPGSMGTVAQGAANSAHITVAEHTAGDPAAGLPSPASQADQLVLEPGTAYVVRFAWVPSDSCPAGDGDSSPGPTPTGDPVGDAQSGAGTQQYRADEQPADGSVAVTHTAEPGGPSSEVTIQGACAGTLYRTGLLPAS